VDRLRSYLLLLVTAIAVLVGAGGTSSANANGPARVGAAHGPAAQLVLRAGADRAPHVPKGEAGGEQADGAAPPVVPALGAAPGVAISDPLPLFDACLPSAPHTSALPRGPPSFV
jgi:hypothetical protein